MIIRQETKNDYIEIYNLVKEAFKTARVSKGDEQDYINQLRLSSSYIPELALVVEDQCKLVAYNILTKFNVNIENSNKKIKSLLLGPICVKLEYRNEKIGEKLINKSLEIAKNMGYEAVFLFGDPNYYYRVGFRQTMDYNIKCLNDISPKNAMAKELVSNVLQNVKGTISFL